MKPIYVKTVFDRKKRSGRTTEGTVDVRLTQERRTLYYSTGIRLLPKHWHAGQVVNRIDAMELQRTLDTLVVRIRRTINDLMEEDRCTLDEVMKTLRESDNNQMSLLDFCRQRAKIRCYGKTDDSRERYHRFLRFFTLYGKMQRFADVTDKKVMEMDEYLSSTGMKPYSKWNNYHRFLNSFILDAIDAGYLKRNPYRWLRIEKDKTSEGLSKYLTREEFDRLCQADLPTDSLRRVRDLFIFQTYTCLSYVDLATFDATRIMLLHGRPAYTATRGKTKQAFTFLILPPAMNILRKYHNRLPVISNVKYNQYLKDVAQAAGISKPISSHWARHTGATMLLNSGMEMEVVSKVLGHSSTKITRQVYAKLLDETVVDAMAELSI